MKKPVPFGKYFLMDRVAVGGMAEVFKAKAIGAEGFSKVVALKRILPNIAEDHDFITMFIDEAKIAVQLSHANVAQILELGEDNGTYFIAMEYVQGKDLRTIFDRAKRTEEKSISPLMAAYAISRVCEGLDYAHRKKDDNGIPLEIVHRDVSPQNIILSYDGDVKLIDFGVAKAQNKMTRTQAGILKGKFSYMSPEQVQGMPLDQRSDIFSLGIVLHEILVGERLFVGKSDFQTLEKVRKADAAPPSASNPDVPPELDEITMKALSKDPNTRYTYASEMHEDLQRFLYSRSPVYSRKNLSGYMKEVFTPDFEKEMRRQLAYDPYFEALQNGTLEPDVPVVAAQVQHVAPPNAEPQHPGMAPTGAWEAHGNTPLPDSYAGAGPQPVQAPSHSGAVPQPVNAMAGQQQAASPYGSQTQQPNYAYNNNYGGAGNVVDDDESTMFDPSGAAAPASPWAAPASAEQAPLPQYDDYDEFEDGESDTIIDMSMTPEPNPPPSGGGKLWLMIILLVGVLGVGVTLFLLKDKLFSSPPPPSVEKGKFFVQFLDSSKGVKFFLNNKPIAPENIEHKNPKRVMLIFPKPGSFILELRKAGHKSIRQRIKITFDNEQETPPQRLKRLIGALQIDSTPPGAVIKVNGIIQSKVTPGKYVLPFGKYIIRIVKQGYTPWQQEVLVKPNVTTPLAPKLKRQKKAKLQVLCHKGKAKLYINGRYKGKIDTSPYSIELRFTRTHRLKVVPTQYKQLTFKSRVAFPLEPLRIIKVHCTPPSKSQKGFVKIISRPASIIQINSAQLNKGKPVSTEKLPLYPGRYKFTFTNPKTRKKKVYLMDIHPGQNPDFVITW